MDNTESNFNHWLEELKFKAKLLQKKNRVRKAIKEKGTLLNGAFNEFDNYEYFSEAQYKELFTDLLSEYGLELKPSEISKTEFRGTEKQPFGYSVTFEFELSDIETGYSEVSCHSGTGIDKGDKAYYKARTGALKTYFSMTFLVATKDDPERDDDKPEVKKSSYQSKKNVSKKDSITRGQLDILIDLFKNNEAELKEMMSPFKKTRVQQLTNLEASKIISKKKEGLANA